DLGGRTSLTRHSPQSPPSSTPPGLSTGTTSSQTIWTVTAGLQGTPPHSRRGGRRGGKWSVSSGSCRRRKTRRPEVPPGPEHPQVGFYPRDRNADTAPR